MVTALSLPVSGGRLGSRTLARSSRDCRFRGGYLTTRSTFLVLPARVELATTWSLAMRDCQLRHGSKLWCGREDLNLHGLLHKALDLARLPLRHDRILHFYFSQDLDTTFGQRLPPCFPPSREFQGHHRLGQHLASFL